MGKRRIIAETGAGQHGVATATMAARLGLPCRIYMGQRDAERQRLNVFRMKVLGAEVIEVEKGSRTLKDAINEALRDWVSAPKESYYLIGSALGPYPYPQMVRDFQSVIGSETKKQILKEEGRLPDAVLACVGGGSNAIGMFSAFIDDHTVQLIGVEAGGKGLNTDQHASRMSHGKVGFFQGTKSLLLQDQDGQVKETHSISAGLDYSCVGPEHAHLFSTGRVQYTSANDDQVLDAFSLLAKIEGILPALESSHAVAQAVHMAPKMDSKKILVVNLSGRGDKDLPQLFEKDSLLGASS